MKDNFSGNRKAQAEMFGFAIIIVVVFVVLLLFLWLSSISSDEPSSNYLGDSFLQSFPDYTSECEKGDGDYVDIEELIYLCANNETCIGGSDSCDVLNSTLTNLTKKSWRVGEDWPTKGYELLITSESEGHIYSLERGVKENATTVTGSSQSLPSRRGIEDPEITFTIYERE